MAMNVVELKTDTVDPIREALKDAFAEAIKSEPAIDGFTLLTYQKDGVSGILSTMTRYSVRDVMDLFVLPDMAKEKIRREIERNVTIE